MLHNALRNLMDWNFRFYCDLKINSMGLHGSICAFLVFTRTKCHISKYLSFTKAYHLLYGLPVYNYTPLEPKVLNSSFFHHIFYPFMALLYDLPFYCCYNILFLERRNFNSAEKIDFTYKKNCFNTVKFVANSKAFILLQNIK